MKRKKNMKIIKIKNWESLNCNKLLFILVEILANNKNILIYIKSKHYNGQSCYYNDNNQIKRKNKTFESKYHVWIKISTLNYNDFEVYEKNTDEYNKEIFGCLHGCIRNITGVFPGFEKIYQTYNQIIKLKWYSEIRVNQNSSIDVIDFFYSNIEILDTYLQSCNYLPLYDSNDIKIYEKKISTFCDHFEYFEK